MSLNFLTKLLVLLLLPLLVTAVSCNKPTEPPTEDIPPGRRDYVWTIDTISTDPFIYITRFWGSAPNDIWAIDRYLFHYDGLRWSEFNTGISDIGAQAIFGFAQNNVWAAGYSNFWHFDGTAWKLFSKHTLEGYGLIYFSNIWGDSPNNIYAMGFANKGVEESKGVIMHYNGVKWNFLNIPTMELSFIDIKSINNKLVVVGYFENSGAKFKLFELDGTKLTEFYNGSDYPKLTYLNNKLFIKIGKEIFKYKEGTLELVHNFAGTEYWDGFWGRTEKDFFCVTGSGLGHYNGSDLATINYFDINKLSLSNAIIFDKEVFFRGRDDQANMSIVIKGRLND